MTNKQQPKTVIRIGRLKAAIWDNESEKGTFSTVTFTRSYKAGDEYKSSGNFGTNDLLLLAKLADKVHSALVGSETYINDDDQDDS